MRLSHGGTWTRLSTTPWDMFILKLIMVQYVSVLWLSLCLVTGGSMQRSFTDFVILCCLLFVLIVQTNNILNNCRALGFAYFASLTASPEQCGEPEGTTKPVAQERLRLAASNSMPGSFNFGLNHKVLNNKSEPNDRFT